MMMSYKIKILNSFFTLIFIVNLFLISWPIQASEKSKASESVNTQEALKIVRDYLNSRQFPCPEVFIFKHSTHLNSIRTNYYQVLEPTFELSIRSNISDVDQLNGLQWKGKATMTFRAIREFNKEKNAWREWTDVHGGSFAIELEKRNNNWQLISSPLGYFEDPEPCNSVPLPPPIKLPPARQ